MSRRKPTFDGNEVEGGLPCLNEVLEKKYGGVVGGLVKTDRPGRFDEEGKGGGRSKDAQPRYRKPEASPPAENTIEKKENKVENSTPNPFMAALQAARQITSNRPHEDQPKELEMLRAAIKKLGGDKMPSIVFRFVGDVLENRSPVQVLFAVAREAHMLGVAHNTAAIAKAIRKNGLMSSDLVNAGIAEVREDKNGNRYFNYKVGHEAIAAAVAKLREAGKTVAAALLAEYIREADRRHTLAAATLRPGLGPVVTTPATTTPAAVPTVLTPDVRTPPIVDKPADSAPPAPADSGNPPAKPPAARKPKTGK